MEGRSALLFRKAFALYAASRAFEARSRPRRKPFKVQSLLLDTGTELRQMSCQENPKIYYRSRMKLYPGGGRELMFATKAIFTPGNSDEAASKKPVRKDSGSNSPKQAKDYTDEPEAAASNFDRSRRRARAKVRDIALSNNFRWFVTLTLDPALIDRYDFKAVQRVLTRWLDNQVRRRGLAYILVPERHKKGGFHFHGLFTDGLEVIESGHSDAAGHQIYNLPGWKLGFTAAIQVYGNYAQAVSYVCKYIGKQGEKPGGRWYYSGGKLEKPQILYGICDDWEQGLNLANAASADAAEAYTFKVPEAGFMVGILRQNM